MKTLLCIRLFIYFLLFLGFLLFTFPFTKNHGHVYASTHSFLKKAEDKKRFKNISLQLVCQCGCKMLLDSCNHLTCMAWSMRSMIDSLILNGYSDEFILNGFENGFKSLVHDHKLFPILEDKRYQSYVSSYEKGFGSSIYSQPKSKSIHFWIFASAFMIIGYVLFFIYKRKKSLSEWDEGSKQRLSKKDEEKLLKELHRG